MSNQNTFGVYKIELVGRVKGGAAYVVLAPEQGYAYEKLRMFVVNRKKAREVAIINVRRARDGGTTWYTTAEGTLFSPSQFKKSPTNFVNFNGTALVDLTPKALEGVRQAISAEGIKLA